MRHYLWLQIKTIHRMPGVLVTILFPIVLIFSIGLIIPTGIFVPAMYTASIAVGAMFFFGVGLMELKESKAKKYLEQTKLSSGTILATHIITTIFFLLIVATWVLFLTWFFSFVVPLLETSPHRLFAYGEMSDVLYQLEDLVVSLGLTPWLMIQVNFSNIKWLQLIYATIINIIVSFGLIFLFVSFTKTVKTYTLVAFVYIFYFLMFGGGGLPPSITNTYSDAFKWLNFLSPHYFVTNIAAGAMNPLSAESILTNLNFSDPEFAADLQIIADWVETDWVVFDFDIGGIGNRETLYWIRNVGTSWDELGLVSESGLFLGRVLDIVVGGQIGGRTVHSLLIEQGHAGLVNPEFANTLLGGLPSLLKVITEIGPFADMVLGMTRTQGLFQLNDLAAYGNLFMPYIYMGITIGTGAYINSKTDQ